MARERDAPEASIRYPDGRTRQVHLQRLRLQDFVESSPWRRVRAVYGQPLRMMARIDGRDRSHVPDFLLVTNCGTVRVVNVKPASRREDPRVADALAWPGSILASLGWG
ncbi:hypothetical protein [Streptomyces sp. JW3]|uniref:hypothetical protein n=1 Tax=Streptomyces sp. JW3 TaxID=3456955 RepID=UPI003FA438CD